MKTLATCVLLSAMALLGPAACAHYPQPRNSVGGGPLSFAPGAGGQSWQTQGSVGAGTTGAGGMAGSSGSGSGWAGQ